MLISLLVRVIMVMLIVSCVFLGCFGLSVRILMRSFGGWLEDVSRSVMSVFWWRL